MASVIDLHTICENFRLRAIVLLAGSTATLFLLLLLQSCSSTPTRHLDIAVANLFQAQVLATDYFKHQIFTRYVSGATELHVYIDGDGLPWKNGNVVSSDPTPHHPLALELMSKDTQSAVYIGRPCQYVLAEDRACEPDDWTFARYSPQVVASMVDAIAAMEKESRAKELVLIGYSGGGVLAVLIASQIASVREVVTVAGNLDVDAWTQSRGFEALTGSVNPVHQPALPEPVRQVHLAGGRDTVVSPDVTQAYTERFGVELIMYPDFDHLCCWVEHWPAILRQLDL